MNDLEIDKIARSSRNDIVGLFDDIKKRLEISDQELEAIRPTAVTSVLGMTNELENGVLAILATMVHIKNKKLRLVIVNEDHSHLYSWQI